jgi:hypothetical protein
MDIKTVLSKVTKAEALTDDEKAFAASFDLQQEINKAAAGARKGAEGKLKEKEQALATLQADIETLRAEAEEKANAGKPEIERMAKEIEKLKKAVADKDAGMAALSAEKKNLIRGGKLNRVMAGLKFVDGIDPDLPRMALEKALAAVEDADLDNDVTVKPILDGWVEKNKALILDQSGGGSGTQAGDRRQASGGTGQKTPDKMTAKERENDLKAQNII